jgi:hypothetical protein
MKKLVIILSICLSLVGCSKHEMDYQQDYRTLLGQRERTDNYSFEEPLVDTLSNMFFEEFNSDTATWIIGIAGNTISTIYEQNLDYCIGVGKEGLGYWYYNFVYATELYFNITTDLDLYNFYKHTPNPIDYNDETPLYYPNVNQSDTSEVTVLYLDRYIIWIKLIKLEGVENGELWKTFVTVKKFCKSEILQKYN